MEAVQNGIFKGVKVGANNVTVTHLQYADDTIFFGEWNKETVKSLMCILKSFEEVSELRVNFNNSKLYGIGVNEDDMTDMDLWMGVVGEVQEVVGQLESKNDVVRGRLIFGKSVLGKWWWRLRKEGGSLWVRVIKSIHGVVGRLNDYRVMGGILGFGRIGGLMIKDFVIDFLGKMQGTDSVRKLYTVSLFTPISKGPRRNTEMEPDMDTENMTISEYLEYEAAKERRLWDDVRSRRSPTNYNEADVDSFHRNKSKTFSYPYSHNLTPPHPCFLPVQPYPKNYLVSTNESNDVDIENMTIAEYNLYVAKQGLGMNPLRAENMKRMGHDIVQDSIWEQDDDSEEDQEEDGDDGDTFDMWDITVEDVERIRKFFNVPDEIDEIVQPLIPEPIHTTPPNDDYVAPATKSILDELLEEFGDEILNVTMVDDEADFNPTKDLEEPERLLAKEPQSNFTEI
ncbi:hypothetical protein Tco_1061170 [Tanacetum coccineum]